MKGTESITIAIPFYQGLDFLAVAISSVLAQSDSRWRLLICDDAGEPGAEALAAGHGDERVRYLRNMENLGMVGNWNRCIESSETPLVTLLHADDRLGPDYVALMLAMASSYPEAAAFFCDAVIIDSTGRPCFSFQDRIKRWFEPSQDRSADLVLEGPGAVESLMAGNFILCPTLCFRREVMGPRRFADSWKQVQDLELTTRLLMEGERLVGARHVAYEYRRHGASASARQTESLLRFDEEYRLFDLVADRADELGWRDVARTSRRKRIVRLHLLYRILADFLSLRPGSALRKLRFLLQGPLVTVGSGRRPNE